MLHLHAESSNFGSVPKNPKKFKTKNVTRGSAPKSDTRTRVQIKVPSYFAVTIVVNLKSADHA